MNAQRTITLILSLILVAWSGYTFVNAVGGDVLWKTIASGVGLLLFGFLFVNVALKMIRSQKEGR